MSTADRLLVFSDLHMAPPGPLNNFHAGPQLAACLKAQCRPDTLLVLNGDIFDFLQLDSHPRHFAPAALPPLITELLAEVGNTPWGRDVFEALRRHIASGGRCVYVPGNHDPEMAHPAAAESLRRALGLAPDEPRLSIHVDSEPLAVTVGRWQVLIGHGHRGDEWNNIDVGQLHRAATEGTSAPGLPRGSRLVLETLNTFKREPDPSTGRPYAFVDLLKPETLTALALLLWVTPRAIRHLPGYMGNQGQAIINKWRHRLTKGRYLGPSGSPPPSDLLDELADAFTATLTESERQEDLELLHMEMENFFAGRGSPGAGMLSGGGRVHTWFGRWVYNSTRHFFETGHLEKGDRKIVQENLPEGSGPRIVISGHTHAARVHPLPGDRLYLNTGTWTDLMHFSEIFQSQDFVKARARFLHNEVPRLRRLCYAEVTPEGGALQWHEPDPVLKFTALP